MDKLTTQQPSRRVIAKGLAWTVPVVSIGAAAPAMAASADEDVVVTSACGNRPTFTISAVGAAIEVGSTFTLTGAALASVTLTAGTGLSVGVLSGGVRIITVTTAIPAGASRNIRVTGAISVFVLTTFTLAVQTIVGNANTNNGNDQASLSLTGLDLGIAIVLFCGAAAAAEAAKKKAAEDAKKKSASPASPSVAPSSSAPSFPSSAPAPTSSAPAPSASRPSQTQVPEASGTPAPTTS